MDISLSCPFAQFRRDAQAAQEVAEVWGGIGLTWVYVEFDDDIETGDTDGEN